MKIGPVDVAVTQSGEGRPFLILHGGAGPQSVTAFADLLAEAPRDAVSALWSDFKALQSDRLISN